MRISRKRKKPDIKKIFFYNERIKDPIVLVLDSEGKRIGEKNTAEAIKLAKEEELDLVLINPKGNPPVAQFMNYGHFKYNQEKEARLKKARQHVVDTKSIRISLRIGQHDLDNRKKQVVKFLNKGDKVKIELVLKGREMQQIARGFEAVREMVKQIEEKEKIRTEQQPEKQGNRISTIIVKD